MYLLDEIGRSRTIDLLCLDRPRADRRRFVAEAQIAAVAATRSRGERVPVYAHNHSVAPLHHFLAPPYQLTEASWVLEQLAEPLPAHAMVDRLCRMAAITVRSGNSNLPHERVLAALKSAGDGSAR